MVFVFQGRAGADGFPYVINDFKFYPTPGIPRPEKGIPYKDPVFHTEIVRITDRVTDGQGKYRYCQPGYPKHDIENADGTILLVQSNFGSGFCFWEANPPYRKLGCIPSSYIGWKRPLDMRWDNKDPHVVYFNMHGKFWKYTITFDENGQMTDGIMEALHDWQEDIDKYFSGLNITGFSMCEEGDASDDRRYWAWAAFAHDPTHSPQWWRTAMIVYDKDYSGKEQGKVVSILKEGEPAFYPPGFISMSPSGKYVWTGDAHKLYTRDLVYLRDLKVKWGHADMAINAGGMEVVAGFAKVPKTGKTVAAMEDLETGEVTYLAAVPAAAHHVSGSSHLRPGWAVYSTYTPSYPNLPTEWGQHEVYMVELTKRTDPPPKVWRLAHTHTVRKEYVDDPFAKVNRRGTKVWFGSGWGCSYADEGCELYVYQINLPSTWYEDLSQVDVKIRH
jgi:hypothetical protein